MKQKHEGYNIMMFCTSLVEGNDEKETQRFHASIKILRVHSVPTVMFCGKIVGVVGNSTLLYYTDKIRRYPGNQSPIKEYQYTRSCLPKIDRGKLSNLHSCFVRDGDRKYNQKRICRSHRPFPVAATLPALPEVAGSQEAAAEVVAEAVVIPTTEAMVAVAMEETETVEAEVITVKVKLVYPMKMS